MDFEDNATMFSKYYKQQMKKRSYFNTNWRFILCLTTVYVLAVTLTFHIYATSIQTLVESEGYSYKPVYSAAEDHLEVDRDFQDYSSLDLDLHAEIENINRHDENQISGERLTKYPYKQRTTNLVGEDSTTDEVNVGTKHTTANILRDNIKYIITNHAPDVGNINVEEAGIVANINQESQSHEDNELKVTKFDEEVQILQKRPDAQNETGGMNKTENRQSEDETGGMNMTENRQSEDETEGMNETEDRRFEDETGGMNKTENSQSEDETEGMNERENRRFEDETGGMNETENRQFEDKTGGMNETENRQFEDETGGMNNTENSQSENETEGMNETENRRFEDETGGMNETENRQFEDETVGMNKTEISQSEDEKGDMNETENRQSEDETGGINKTENPQSEDETGGMNKTENRQSEDETGGMNETENSQSVDDAGGMNETENRQSEDETGGMNNTENRQSEDETGGMNETENRQSEDETGGMNKTENRQYEDETEGMNRTENRQFEDETEGINKTEKLQFEDEIERTNIAKDEISSNQNGQNISVNVLPMAADEDEAPALDKVLSKIIGTADVDEDQGNKNILKASSYNDKDGDKVIFSDSNQIEFMNTKEKSETSTTTSLNADNQKEPSVDRGTTERTTANIQDKNVFESNNTKYKTIISNKSSEMEIIQNIRRKRAGIVPGQEALGGRSRNVTGTIVSNEYSELHCKGYKIRLSDSSLSHSALASFPGSGNTWVRHLIHYATGIATGSVYTDGALYHAGFIGEYECIDKPTACIVQKTHELPFIDGIKYDKAVLLIRNPYDAILSYFKFNKVGHKKDFHVPMDKMTDEWTEFVKSFGQAWLRFNYEWINNFAGDEYLMVYENLKSDTVGEITKLSSFLNKTIDATDKLCIEEHKEGDFRRRHIINDGDDSLYTASMKIEINSYIQNITSVIYKRFPDVYLPWGSSL